ncbi:MAG: hypothetical protein ACLSAH_12795 [Bilophila wadsworthia]
MQIRSVLFIVECCWCVGASLVLPLGGIAVVWGRGLSACSRRW